MLSRGIDIDGIDLVINFDVPGDAEDYVHRIGRTARASAEGEAITLISKEDRHRFRRIEELVDMKVRRIPLPDELGDAEPGQGGGGGRDGGRGRGRGRGRGKKRSGGGGNRSGGSSRSQRSGSNNQGSDGGPRGDGKPKKFGRRKPRQD